MLRLTESEEAGSYVLIVEGKLMGAALIPIGELLQRLPAALASGKPVVVDLMGVTSIDGEGKEVLKQLHAHGATFRAKGCLNRAIVDGITCCSPESTGVDVPPVQQSDSKFGGKRT